MYQSYYIKTKPGVRSPYQNPYGTRPDARRRIIRKKRLPIKRLTALFFCLFLLFCVLKFSFDSFIYDVLAVKASKIYDIDYEKIIYPASSMLPEGVSKREINASYDVQHDAPLMIDIPAQSQRIGLRASLLALAEKYKKIHPAVYVFEYGGKSYVDINAYEKFPAASIIKLPVLIELFRKIDNEKFSLFDTMVFEEYYRTGGSGRLKYSEGGKAHTLDHLARIMIEDSDNSSTNMIISKIGGMPEVNASLQSWGLEASKINNWLPDLGGTNIISAYEAAKMFYNLDLTNIVSPSSKRYIASYLGNVKNTRLLKAGLPKNAKILHKTGDIGYMLGDAGIVKTPGGRKYIVVVLAMRPYNSSQGKDFIVKASNLIYNSIAAE